MRKTLAFFVLGAVAAGAQVPGVPAPAAVVRLQVDPASFVSQIPDDFVGFGYETSAAARPGFFSPGNATLVQLYRTLGADGLVRIGGNISDYTRFLPAGVPVVKPQPETTIINRAALDGLAAFLRATGWTAMWGLNLKTGSKQQAVEEALAVNAALGDRLHSFEIGNEVDLRPALRGHYEKYLQAYRQYKAAIRSALPSAVFCGPDAAGNTDWSVDFASAEGRDIKLVTQHYYRCRASNPIATLPTLLADDPEWDAKVDRLQALGRARGVPFRINEVNSFSGGGKPGVSDTLGAALWCLDYMFNLALHGCAGVNIETDVNQFAWVSHYSPIFRDAAGSLHARPVYYGMLAFAVAGKGALLELRPGHPSASLRAYATRPSPGLVWVTVINKDLGASARVELDLPAGYSVLGAYGLRGPSALSTDQVTLAGAAVAPDGTWKPGALEEVPSAGGVASVTLPAASAELIQLRRQ